MLIVDPESPPPGGTEPLTLAPGVVFHVRPWTSAYAVFGRREAARLDESAESEDRELAFTTAVAQRAVAAWNGVVGPDRKPLLPTRKAVAAVMRDCYPVYAAFDSQYVLPHLVTAAEKNASSVSRNGTSAAGRTTAARAATTKAASAKSAPTSSRTRKPTKARSSGK